MTTPPTPAVPLSPPTTGRGGAGRSGVSPIMTARESAGRPCEESAARDIARAWLILQRIADRVDSRREKQDSETIPTPFQESLTNG